MTLNRTRFEALFAGLDWQRVRSPEDRRPAAYPAELRERGVRLFRENRADYSSDSAAYSAIAPKLD